MAQSPETAADFFDAALSTFERIEAPLIEKKLLLGGRSIRLRFAGDALLPRVMPALEHLPQDDSPEANLTVCLWDAESTDVRLPPKPWSANYEDVGATGVVRGFNDERFSTVELQSRYHGVDTVQLYDHQHRIGIFYCPDAARLPIWMASFPLRVIFHCWTVKIVNRPIQLVHAGAVGLPEGGVLLAGRGGSGKSTTAVACLNSDLRYIGDDYVMIQLEPSLRVHTLYNTAKLVPDSLTMLPWITDSIPDFPRLEDDKALLYLHQHFAERLIDGFPLRAIFHLRVTGRPETRLTPTTTIKMLAELAPTTTFQLRTASDVVVKKLSDLVKRVPVYTLELGTNLDRIPQVILDFLKEQSR